MSSVPDIGPAENTAAGANATAPQPQPAPRERVGCQDDGAPQVVVALPNVDWHLGDAQLLDEAQARLLADLVVAEQTPSVDLQRFFSLVPAGQLRALDCFREIELQRERAIQARNAAMMDERTRAIQMMPGEIPPANSAAADAAMPATEQLVRYISDENTSHNDGFAALIATLPTGLGTEAIFAARETLLLAAEIWHSSQRGFACQIIQRRFRAQRYATPPIRELRAETEARHQAATAAAAEQGDPLRVRDVFQDMDASVPDNLEFPAGWTVSRDGIRSDDSQCVPVAAPVLIVGRLRNRSNRTEMLQLLYLRDGAWRPLDVKRSTVASAREIVGLAAFGVPVTSNNAADLVQYLSEFEAVNAGSLPVTEMAEQFGWHDDGFLLGRDFITTTSSDADEGTQHAPVRFVGADDGNEQLADGYVPSGTLEGWLAAISPLRAFPRVLFAIYAALSAAMLHILRAGNFCVDYAAETSSGKTFTLRVAASVWGQPLERNPNAALATWDTTHVGIERRCATLNCTPAILDDTKLAPSREFVAEAIYDVCSGRGRTRGSKPGLASVASWSTVLLMSGEAPATSSTGDGGSRARVLALWDSPFERRDAATAAIINEVSVGIHQHYGHAARAFIQFLLRTREQWDEYRQIFAERLRHFQERAGDNGVARRMAEHLAVVATTEVLVHRAIGFPWPDGNVLEHLYAALTADSAEADRARVALLHVVNWAYAHRGDFLSSRPTYGGKPPDRYMPAGGWLGRWDAGNEWVNIAFFEHVLVQVLQDGKFEEAAVLKSWHSRGYLQTNGDRRRTLRVRMEGRSTPSMIAIPRHIVEEVLLEAAGTCPPPPTPETPAPSSSTVPNRRRGVVGNPAVVRNGAHNA